MTEKAMTELTDDELIATVADFYGGGTSAEVLLREIADRFDRLREQARLDEETMREALQHEPVELDHDNGRHLSFCAVLRGRLAARSKP